MNVLFKYSRERDIRCILTKGKSSNNSQNATKVYQQLVAAYGENPTNEDTDAFIDAYFAENKINLEESISAYQKEWDAVAEVYTKRAESIFGATLPYEVTAYLTINSRCPYSIEDNLFYISVPTAAPARIAMHELWHFYTWYGLGTDEEEKLGKQKYNDLKEALTVLLNVECRDLLPEGVSDAGYPQHQELRQQMLEFWKTNKNIAELWRHFTP